MVLSSLLHCCNAPTINAAEVEKIKHQSCAQCSGGRAVACWRAAAASTSREEICGEFMLNEFCSCREQQPQQLSALRVLVMHLQSTERTSSQWFASLTWYNGRFRVSNDESWWPGYVLVTFLPPQQSIVAGSGSCALAPACSLVSWPAPPRWLSRRPAGSPRMKLVWKYEDCE